MIWAAARQNQQNDMCARRRLRSDWASQGICPIWSESSLSAHWVAKIPGFLHVDREDCDQTRWVPTQIILLVFHAAALIFWNSLTFFEGKKKKINNQPTFSFWGERGGSVVECRTPEREVRGSRPTAAVLCPWARHFTPWKYWLITQEAMAPSRHDWKIVDWDVKPQHNQRTFSFW